ncbi:MAG: hypothetical protein NTV22_05925 [bacterium]|nr:hypothetical protein [bacterium]
MRRTAARLAGGLGALLLWASACPASMPFATLTNAMPEHFTSVWTLARTRAMPLAAADATPLVIATDDNEQLWIADQTQHEVCAYKHSGTRTQRVSVPARGVVTSISFGDDQRILFALQRGTPSFPLGDLRVHTGQRLVSKDYGLLYTRTYPNYWDGSRVSTMVANAQARREYCAASPPTTIIPRTACISRRGTVYVAVPLLSLIERYASNGRTYTAFTLAPVRPLVPCSLIVTRDEELVLADALRNRIIVMDSRARVKTVLACQDAQQLFIAPHYKTGWLMLDPAAAELSLFASEGRLLQTCSTRGMSCAAALMPARNTLWLFDTQHWTWQDYAPHQR